MSAQALVPLAYEVDGRPLHADAPGFGRAIAACQANGHRPRCLCQARGAPMYVARLGTGYIVKRMPGTGQQHAPACPHYAPPDDGSGLALLLGSAISEDPTTGCTTLKLDFALTRMAGRSVTPANGEGGDSARTRGPRLSLRALLHYLWEQAELTRWHPGFAGKRTWAIVRRHLLLAAQQMVVGGHALASQLYVPAPFNVEGRDTINARRQAQWQHALPMPGRPQRLMLLIGEVKEISRARYGYKAIVKHLPDQAFMLDDALYRQLGRRFSTELELWATDDEIHMMMAATFGLNAAGAPAVHEVCLVPVTGQWLPVVDSIDGQLVAHLVEHGRSFIKVLPYGLGHELFTASATLTDCGVDAPTLHIARDRSDVQVETADGREGGNPIEWVWQVAATPIPCLPGATPHGHRIQRAPAPPRGVALRGT